MDPVPEAQSNSSHSALRYLALGGCSMVALILAIAITHRSVTAMQGGASSAVIADHYYTVEQAERGKLLFNKNCGYCHIVAAETDPRRVDTAEVGSSGPYMEPSTSKRGIWLGSRRILWNLGGRYLQAKAHGGQSLYPSVYHLYQRIQSMPPVDVDSIGPSTRTDIIAFLLQANGFPPGPKQLQPVVSEMKAMWLLEPGFERVFNGNDFSGIRFLLGHNCAPPPGCGKTEPGSVFTIRDGVMVCSGKIHGYWYPDKKYFNLTLRFDLRFVRPPDWEGPDDIFLGQSGYWLFVTQHGVWPNGMEIEGRHRDLLSSGGRNRKYDYEAVRRLNKLGEWNSVEITAKNGHVTAALNGTPVLSVDTDYKEPGYIAFQSQGTEIHWRNIRIKEE
jgi:hypothetical protein